MLLKEYEVPRFDFTKGVYIHREWISRGGYKTEYYQLQHLSGLGTPLGAQAYHTFEC